jgi:ribosome biogenesis GTPase A
LLWQKQAVQALITLETPEEYAVWLVAGELQDAKRQVKKDAIELDHKIRFKQIPRPVKSFTAR